MRRRSVFGTPFVLAALMAAQPASAGGSLIEPNGTRVRNGPWELGYAAVGATVTMRGTFSKGQQASVDEGPWYAYLTSDTSVPARRTEPMLLGPVRITQTETHSYVATAAFVAPAVPTGSYRVDVCNAGCSEGVGDLVGGTIALGATVSEARLFARAQILRWMHEYDERTIGQLRKEQAELRSEGQAAMRRAELATVEVDAAEARASDAAGEVSSLAALLEDANRERDVWRLVAGATLLTCLIVVIVWAIRSRRRSRVVVPDTPAELVGEADPDRAWA
jgi:hypothetical protein